VPSRSRGRSLSLLPFSLEGLAVLVLSRKVGERIVIGDGEIVVTVLQVAGGVVRLGIDAPRGVPVNREEVLRSLRREGRRDVSDPRPSRRARSFAA
jgi:carbon storage regulator CsrA